jgi:hypothetical protein
MGNYSEALAEEIKRLRAVLLRIIDTPGRDVDRLKRIAQEALEKPHG